MGIWVEEIIADNSLIARLPQPILHKQLSQARNKRILYFAAKRIFDILVATCLLILFAPLFILIAILIKLDSRGPIVFAQPRVGCKQSHTSDKLTWYVYNFQFYKFRSMMHNADQTLHQSQIQAYVAGQTALEQVGSTKINHDPRITRFGHILRKTSLDELPQLINVLKGDMSLVGPRPIPVYEFEHYESQHCRRFYASQGLTGWWQVKGRCTVTFDEQIELDNYYAENQSFWLDIKILLLTIPAVMSGKGSG